MKNTRHLSKALVAALFLSTLCAPGWSAQPPVENPVGYFHFTSPGDPPSGPSAITPMAFLMGSYMDGSTYLPTDATVDLAMDESGKVLAMSQMDGFADKKTQGNQLTRTLFVRTVNGVPVLTAKASAGGMYDDGVDDQSTKGSGKALIPLGPAPAPDMGLQEVSLLSSHSGKRSTNSDKEKPTTSSLFLDSAQVNSLVYKDWGMFLYLIEDMDAKGRPVVTAYVFLDKPDGNRTAFGGKTVKYSEKNGYSASFSKGVILDQFGNPKKDSKGKDLIDKYSQIKFSKLLFRKDFDSFDVPFWTPAAGGVEYKFLGQKGFGHAFNFDIAAVVP